MDIETDKIRNEIRITIREPKEDSALNQLGGTRRQKLSDWDYQPPKMDRRKQQNISFVNTSDDLYEGLASHARRSTANHFSASSGPNNVFESRQDSVKDNFLATVASVKVLTNKKVAKIKNFPRPRLSWQRPNQVANSSSNNSSRDAAPNLPDLGLDDYGNINRDLFYNDRRIDSCDQPPGGLYLTSTSKTSIKSKTSSFLGGSNNSKSSITSSRSEKRKQYEIKREQLRKLATTNVIFSEDTERTDVTEKEDEEENDTHDTAQEEAPRSLTTSHSTSLVSCAKESVKVEAKRREIQPIGILRDGSLENFGVSNQVILKIF